MQYEEWEGFVPGKWCDDEVDVRDFIQRNYTPYEGDASFLAPATEATKKLWQIVLDLSAKEREAGGVLDADTKIVSTLTSHGPGYLDKELEKIVGLQTDKPFKRALQPFGGIRMSEEALNMYGYTLDPQVKEIFTKYRKTHNDGVYSAYTPKCARRVRRIFSRVCPTLTAAAVSSGITAAWRFTASIILSARRKRTSWRWTGTWFPIRYATGRSFPSRSRP